MTVYMIVTKPHHDVELSVYENDNRGLYFVHGIYQNKVDAEEQCKLLVEKSTKIYNDSNVFFGYYYDQMESDLRMAEGIEQIELDKVADKVSDVAEVTGVTMYAEVIEYTLNECPVFKHMDSIKE